MLFPTFLSYKTVFCCEILAAFISTLTTYRSPAGDEFEDI
jgi:hypothetical protein